MSDDRQKMNRDTMEAAFDAVATKAAAEDLVLEILVYGGSCLVLASNIREASGDIDAVYLNKAAGERSRTQEIADEVRRERPDLQLPRDWLNQAVRQMLDPDKGVRPAHPHLFKEYPRESFGGVGLRVMVPHPAYMLAMKILAQRDGTLDASKIETDRTDAIGLMKITGLRTEQQITNLMKSVYPGLPGLGTGAFNKRVEAKIKGLVKACKDEPDGNVPTWNIAGSRRGSGRS